MLYVTVVAVILSTTKPINYVLTGFNIFRQKY